MLLTVVLQSKSARIAEGLTYRSDTPVLVGSVVLVPLRSSTATGIVVSTTEDRATEFSIKTILQVLSPFPALTEQEMTVLNELARHNACTFRQALSLWLYEKNWVQHCLERKIPAPVSFLNTNLPRLTEDQVAALAALRAHRQPCVLRGLPGTGKTTVLLHFAIDVLKSGKQTLLLTPDVQTAAHVAHSLATLLPDVKSAQFHSALSVRQKRAVAVSVATGQCRVIVGTRSALFLPFSALGLVGIEEEHAWTYESERFPYYQARDVAVSLCMATGARLVLSSAVPSLTSLQRVQSSDYCSVELPRRTTSVTPRVSIVSLRDVKTKNHYPITPQLLASLQRCLAAKKQAVLFLNKTGHHSIVMCSECGERYRTDEPAICIRCGGSELRKLGAGIDSVTATLSLLLPEAKVITVSGNVKDKNAIARFIRREADIVVGTQTVIHGLHAPGVSLVAVLVADVGLHSSDYRSGERSFQHIIEAAGRANCSFPSEVIIQTFTPEAKEMLFAQSFDTHGYAAYELAIRKKLSYPPFGTVIEVLDPSCSRSEINNAFLQAGVTAKISEGFADENKKKKFIIRADDEGKMLTALASFRVRYCIHR